MSETLPAPRSRRAPRIKGTIGGVLVLTLLSLLGCAPEGKGAAAAAQKFHKEVSSGNTSEACSMLGQEALEKAGGETECEEQLESVELAGSGQPLRTEVFGREAMVEFEDDVVFLVASGSGWKISGAGCTPQGESPYKCEVGGK
ncbi:hypothetical protein [Arthrobacter sp.]|uniref:hypothetical protein n=1 Tax=Arthrobacter sp. TaxID=1667 RepID=UPI002810B2E3|nr:hypothetical protein [Arthrobacter sp.]